MKKIDIRRLRLRLGAFIVVACTGAISFMSSRDLADMAHFGWLSWLFPVCLDAVAAVALDIWMRRSGAQRIAGWLGMTAIVLSTASNAADHYLSTGLVLAAVLGVAPPAMLAWMLLALHKHAAPMAGTAAPAVPLAPLVPEIRYPSTSTAPITPVPDSHEWIGASGSRYQTADRPVPQPAPVPTAQDQEPASYSTVAPPETDSEKTLVMAPIGRKVSEPGETRTKAVPARTKNHLVSMPVGRATEANADLAKQLAEEGTVPARRQIMTRFGVGTGRATTIARLAEELIAS